MSEVFKPVSVPMVVMVGTVGGLTALHDCVAQTPQPQDAVQASQQIEDVVVTARRVAESIQRTPVAVTALTSEELELKQIHGVMDVQRSAPNVAITNKSPGGSSYGYVTIRGQTNSQVFLVNDPAIGVYVDGAYVGHATGQLASIFDVDRVEVLRGPQGTLFGRNTTGGAINVSTRAPEGEWGGFVRAGMGNYDGREFAAVLNVPIAADEFAVRLSARHASHDGYVRNAYRNSHESDADDRSYRVAVSAAPEEAAWDLLITANQTERSSHGAGPVFVAYNPGSPIESYATARPIPGYTLDDFLHGNGDFYTSYGDTPAYDRMKTRGVTGTFNVDIGNLNVKSISSWQDLEVAVLSDFDSTPYPLIPYFNTEDQKQFSQELQISGEVGRASYIGGLYYFDESGRDLSLLPSATTGAVSQSLSDVINTSYALYGQMNYQLTQRLRLTTGLRYTEDERTVSTINLRDARFAPTGYANPPLDTVANCANGFPNNGTTSLGQNDGANDPFSLCRLTLEESFGYASYLLSLDFQATDDLLLYAKTSKSSLAGGWNARAGAPALSFDPEGARDVELGMKKESFDRRLRTNLAAFYTWNTDVQRSVFGINSGLLTSYLLNAGKGHIYGVEFEATLRAWTGMEIFGSLGLLEAGYDKFAETRLDANGPYVLDRSDERYPGVPETTFSIAATQTLPASFGEWTLHLDYSYIGDQVYYDLTPDPRQGVAAFNVAARAKELALAPSYGLLNARVALQLDRGGIEIAAWVRNITDEKYYTRTYPNSYTSLGVASVFPGDPRTFGASVTIGFGAGR